MHLLGPKIIEEEVHSGRMGFEIMARGFFLRSMAAAEEKDIALKGLIELSKILLRLARGCSYKM